MMPANLRWRVPLVLGVIALACWYAFPLQKRISLGLDLRGGMHVILKVDATKIPPEARDKDITGIALEIVRNRVDQFGVREPLIQRQGTDHILVQLPGVTDRERALSLIGQTALLEFQLVSQSSRLLEQALAGTVPTGYRLAEDEQGQPLLLETDGTLTGAILSDAYVQAGELGLPEVSFRLNKEGAKAFGRLTGANINRQLAIVLDGKVQSAPTIQSRITDAGQITGRFTREEANDLAIVLRAGSLPAPIVVEEERTVGPTLGRDSIQAGLRATALGLALVVVFMVGYYWLPGLIAVVALALNFLLILAGLGYFHATLTLPGIAGMILTLGMAVDANVLINERMREELRAGRPLSLAIGAGYDKALSAIVDSNLTTLIAALFLYWFGTGPIRGFATTLAIGLLASLFTAVFVTHVIFDIMLGAGWMKGKTLAMLQLFKQTKIDFVGKRYICWLISLATIGLGMTAFVMRGPDRYGIDFTGGLLLEYRFSQPVEADQLRHSLRKVGLGDAIIQRYGAATEWLVRTNANTDAEIQSTVNRVGEVLRADYDAAHPEQVRLERVGPTVGAILRTKAWLAMGWSLVGILVYVALRFRHVDFGTAGIIALIHDVVVASGALCLTGRQIDLTVVAALLTIAGYSINDTIVIYDRIRELMRANRKMGLVDVINLGINECLSRTILTSSVTLLTVIALYWFGGEVLRDFSFCLIAGFISGVYSTIYIASAIVVMWRQGFKTA